MKQIQKIAFFGVLIYVILLMLLINIDISIKAKKPVNNPVEIQIQEESPMLYTWDSSEDC
jgi:hypothetical protein